MTRSARRPLAALAAVLVALLMVSGCNQSAADVEVAGEKDELPVLVFAALPSHRFATLRQSHQPILELLKIETGREIFFQTATDFAAIIDGLRAGEIDIAALGPFSYVLAKQQDLPITVVAARVDEKGGISEYRSYGITWSGSPIQALADFRGKRICLVDRHSTSGYLYARAGLLDVGIELDRDTIPVFVGRHDAAVLAVANRHCDAGFAGDRVGDQQLIDEGRLRPGQIIKVWESGPIPGPPIVIADHLPAELRRQLTTVFQDKANADYLRKIGICGGECEIADGISYGYQPTDDAAYDGVRQLCVMIQEKSCISDH